MCVSSLDHMHTVLSIKHLLFGQPAPTVLIMQDDNIAILFHYNLSFKGFYL